MKNTRLIATSIFLVNLLIVHPTIAGEHLLQPKIGLVDWADNNNHKINNNTFNLNDSVEPSAGFMYLYRLDNGFSFGGEVFSYEKEFTHTNGNTGDMDVSHLYALAEYYFNNKGNVKPFIGIGLGGVRTDLTGAINQEASGFSAQIKAGVEFVINKRFSISAEGKYFSVDIDEEVNGAQGDIDSDGYAVFTGFTIKL